MIINENSFEWMKTKEEASIDHIITDPPYLIDFMNKGWDTEDNVAGSVEFWKEALRVCKSGSYALVFGHSRTHHRVMVAMENAGWEIRDTIMWLYGSGFPKSHNLGDGWGSALKPAYEPIIMARKPFKGSLENNWKTNGLGGLNIDDCRVGTSGGETHKGGFQKEYVGSTVDYEKGGVETDLTPKGRFPANIILDEEAGKLLDEQSGITKSAKQPTKPRKQGYSIDGYVGGTTRKIIPATEYGDEGGASRFFYCSKTSNKERNYGPQKNNHPTVKPIELMKYLVKLVSKEGQTILDPFTGSGSTGIAVELLGREFIGVELDKDYCEIAEKRISAWREKK